MLNHSSVPPIQSTYSYAIKPVLQRVNALHAAVVYSEFDNTQVELLSHSFKGEPQCVQKYSYISVYMAGELLKYWAIIFFLSLLFFSYNAESVCLCVCFFNSNCNECISFHFCVMNINLNDHGWHIFPAFYRET